MFRPQQISELRTAVQLLVPTYEKYNGVSKKTFPETGKTIFVNFKSRGGTDVESNGVLSVLDTAEVVTWFDPDIKSDCAIKLESGAIYQITGEPEDVELQHQFMMLKVERYKGKV
jgi:hypothetical protein